MGGPVGGETAFSSAGLDVQPLHRLDIAGLIGAYRSKRLRAQEVVEHHLSRIAHLDQGLRSFIEIDRAGALAAAAESDRRYDHGPVRSLEGVPVAIKANIAVLGLEWNAGMALRRGMVADRDAEVVGLLRDAGAVVLGTLNMHEAALGMTTDNPWFGTAFNPHGEGRTPGGSSGGSGAAVAAGFCAAALGTDTLGSVRIPAAFNGVFGLKPTHAALPATGVVPVCEALDDVGPLARSIADLKLVWTVVGARAPGRTSPTFKRLLTLDNLGEAPCDPQVLGAMALAAEALPTFLKETLRLPALAAIRGGGFLLCARELTEYLASDRTDRGDLISSDMHRLLDFRDRPDPDPGLIGWVANQLHEALGDDGVLLTPTAPQTAFRQGDAPPPTAADFTSLANISGLPALSIPAGQGKDGMPVAIQLIGPAGGDAALIDLGEVIDRHLQGYAPPRMF